MFIPVGFMPGARIRFRSGPKRTRRLCSTSSRVGLRVVRFMVIAKCMGICGTSPWKWVNINININLDDALLLPALIWLTLRLLPKEVLQDCRLQAEEWMQRLGKRPISQLGLVFVLLVWFIAFGTVFVWLA